MKNKKIKKAYSQKIIKKRSKKTDYNIPSFGFKSSIIIVLSALISTTIVPYLLSLLNISFNLGIILSNAIITSYAVAYTRFFIETKKTYCKKFWITYALFSISFGTIGFFWIYLKTYI